jgi:N-acetylglucosamine malate deacetylase 1
MTPAKRAFAIAAHPDDIEFQMAGTLILLQRAGYEIHYMNIANGSCGTTEYSKQDIIAIRREEAQLATTSIGAIYHESLVDDFAIFYEPTLLAKVAATMRDVAPEILLLQSPQDYMEDHQNAARLAVTAAFAREMPNFATDPPRNPIAQPVTVYHAQPHGNRDPLGNPVMPDMVVDISNVLDVKRSMLAFHKSQKTWLDKTQGMDAYLDVMQDLNRELGTWTGQDIYAEGWRKRRHLGLCDETANPLFTALQGFVNVSHMNRHSSGGI